MWLGNDDYPPKNFKGSGFWKFKAPKADKKEDDDGKNKEFYLLNPVKQY